MKKIIALVLVLIFSSFSALASGFDGLGINSSANANAASSLPDPAESMDDIYGSLINTSYEFSAGYICDVYAYEKPVNTSSFINSYSSRCRSTGYTITEAAIEGQNGYTIQNGDGLYAMLFPDVNGQVLFMVQDGMSFSLKTRTDYATCLYNNRKFEYVHKSYSGDDVYNFYNGIDVWDIMFHAEGNAPFDWIKLSIPLYVAEGDEFYLTEGDFVPGFGLMIPSGYVLDPLDTENWYLRGYNDYAHLIITKCEETERGALIEGVFSCSLDEGEIVFEDFTFSVMLKD